MCESRGDPEKVRSGDTESYSLLTRELTMYGGNKAGRDAQVSVSGATC